MVLGQPQLCPLPTLKVILNTKEKFMTIATVFLSEQV